MAKCVSDAVEGALRKFTTEVMDPQKKSENEEFKALETEISLRDEEINSLQSSVAELEKSVVLSRRA